MLFNKCTRGIDHLISIHRMYNLGPVGLIVSAAAADIGVDLL
jgi:hypothetical protein